MCFSRIKRFPFEGKKNIHKAGPERESRCCKRTSLKFKSLYSILIFVTDVVAKKRERDAVVLSAVVSCGLSELEVSVPPLLTLPPNLSE